MQKAKKNPSIQHLAGTSKRKVKIPPPGYVCNICEASGDDRHYILNCPDKCGVLARHSQKIGIQPRRLKHKSIINFTACFSSPCWFTIDFQRVVFSGSFEHSLFRTDGRFVDITWYRLISSYHAWHGRPVSGT